MAPRSPFTRPERGVLRATIDGLTYTAMHYPIQTSDRTDYDREGNDWYEANERNVRDAILAYAERRRQENT